MKPISLQKKSPVRFVLAAGLIVGVAVVGYLAYRYVFYGSSARWNVYRDYLKNPQDYQDYVLQAGQRCGDAPFAFPSTGMIFGLWDQSYRPGHRHSGIDIFAGTEPGVTPVYAAYDGYLTREADWVSTVIIRIPSDPLHPGEQVWMYYTHMASEDGESYVADDFPPGTYEVFVPEGTLLGYEGNYSGDPVNPTGLHLHFSVVKDNGQGGYLNELELNNTYDPSPYFNLTLNDNVNPDDFVFCEGEVTLADWATP